MLIILSPSHVPVTNLLYVCISVCNAAEAGSGRIAKSSLPASPRAPAKYSSYSKHPIKLFILLCLRGCIQSVVCTDNRWVMKPLLHQSRGFTIATQRTAWYLLFPVELDYKMNPEYALSFLLTSALKIHEYILCQQKLSP